MSKVKIQIKSYLGAILFEYESEGNTIAETVRRAVLRRADLRGADLRRAVLRGADLRRAVLRGADLSDADLSDADLRRAVLRGADLRRADLSDADLSDADLRGADLSDAVLRGADLRRADLRRAKIEDITELGEYTELCTRDMMHVFTHLKPELPGLRQALVDGRINGTQYEGRCACLIGTLGGNTEEGAKQICESIPNYTMGLHNPSEQWFWQIREGDTPENSLFAAQAVKLIDEVLAEKSA